jgi:CRP-like cAMP-binding protein
MRQDRFFIEAIASSGKMKSKGRPAFTFLDSADAARKIVEFQIKATIFAQGDPTKTVMYIQKGRVKLSVVNATGKEAVVAVLGLDDFLGEGPERSAHLNRDGNRDCAKYSARD